MPKTDNLSHVTTNDISVSREQKSSEEGFFRLGRIYQFSVRPLSAEEFEVNWSEKHDQHFVVFLSDRHHKALTGLAVEKKILVEFSINFLFQRLSPEAIRHVFDVSMIGKHFPEFSSEVKLFCQNQNQSRV